MRGRVRRHSSRLPPSRARRYGTLAGQEKVQAPSSSGSRPGSTRRQREGMASTDRQRRAYDLVTFGEAMVRLCPPGFGRLEAATLLEMQPGGAELNTAVGVARLGADPDRRTGGSVRVAWVSRLPRNPLGQYLANKAREQGVMTDEILWDDDPTARCGTYFLEEGAAPRASSVVYDRANSAFARLQADELDWPVILRGARFFLVTGITPALGPGC